MPLHELYSMAKGKLDPKEMNSTCATGQSSAPENDFFELVWENGQISMQGLSNRARKSPTCKSFPSHNPRGQDKDVGHANGTNIRMGKFGDLDTGLNDIRMPVPSGEVGLSQDEDVIPWLNYGMDDSLQHEYSSHFLDELSGVTINDHFSMHDRRSSCDQIFRDSQRNSSHHDLSSGQGILSKGSLAAAGEVETNGPKASTSQLYRPPVAHQFQTSLASVRSDISENKTSNATQHPPCGEITQIPSSSSGISSLTMEKQGPIMSSNSSTIMNFSHFARPAAIVKANLHTIGLTSGLSSSRSESVGIKNNGAASATTRSNPPESTKVDSTMQSQKVIEPSKVGLKPLGPKPLEQNVTVSKKSEPACKEDVSKVGQTYSLVVGESDSKGQEDVEKSMEQAVASSSVCSGNGAERGSNDPHQNLKRKSRDTEDSECHSEDVEEESVGVKKYAPARRGMDSKRSRSAEVHNLSERKRRDRINEKMRALQELIPNCNKVDKSSMLDEAIEYIKTLQLQLQIMSMGAGLYMPTMMSPAGMQHMHALHMASFAPMDVGMQMGLGVGYGVGMPDVNGGSSRFPMVQVPHMQGTHLPVAHTSGPTSLHGNPQVFGFPCQGFPIPMPRAPLVSFPGEPLMNSSTIGLNACGTAGLVDSASASTLKDPIPNVNSQVVQNSGCNLTSQMSTQCEETIGRFEHSNSVHNSGKANDSGADNPGKEDNLMLDKSCDD